MPDTLGVGLVILFHSSVEAFNDHPVAPHGHHRNSDTATRNMDFLPTSPSRAFNIPQVYERPTL